MPQEPYIKALLLGWNPKRVRKIRRLLMNHGIIPEWHWPKTKQGLSFPSGTDLVICSTDNNSHASASYIRSARKKKIPVIHMSSRRVSATKRLTKAGYPLLSFDEMARRILATDDEAAQKKAEDADFGRLMAEMMGIPILTQAQAIKQGIITQSDADEVEERNGRAVLEHIVRSNYFKNAQVHAAERDAWLFDEESQEVEAESESEDATEQTNTKQQEDTMSRKRKHKNATPKPPDLITLTQAASLIQKGEQTVRDAINQGRLTFVRNEKGEFLLDPIEVKKLPTTKLIYTMDSAEEKKYLLGFLPKKIASEPWGKDAEYSVGLIKEIQEENGGTPRGWLVTRLLGSLRSQFGIKHRNAGGSGKVTVYVDYAKYTAECTKYNFKPVSSEDLQNKVRLKNVPSIKEEVKPKEEPKPKEQPMPQDQTVDPPKVDPPKEEEPQVDPPKASTSLEELLKEVRKKMADRDIVQLVITPTEVEAKVMVVQTKKLLL